MAPKRGKPSNQIVVLPEKQTPHPLSEKERSFLALACDARERELHALAAEMLGSSYFCEKTHSFTKWSKQ